jgi:aminoglycoside phosphotransferase (APT) family kinase protein
MSQALVDVAKLGPWLDSRGLESGLPVTVEPLVGGRSNAMFVIARGSSEWVLRRPNQVAVERANDGMRREFRMLAALDGSPVPHPHVVALCDDDSVLGCTFYLMERVVGVHPIPAPEALDTPAGRRAIAFALVEALAHLHQVDWRAAGLADLGHPEQFHERQVSRWTRQLASYQGRELPGIERITAWLGANIPAHFEPSIMHADFHMMNVLIAPDEPARLVAVLDWETATIGDPLLDLAGFCEVWCSVAPERNGWPSRAELVAHYGQTFGPSTGELPPSRLTYYEVLYNFRLAVLLEGVYTRSLSDPVRGPQPDVAERVLLNLARAEKLVAG